MTEEQYKRSGKAAYPVVMISCAMVLGTLIYTAIQETLYARTVIQAVIILFAMTVATVTYLKKDYTKRGMIIIAGMGALMYLAVSIFNASPYSVMYGFVILICCMSYMNRRLIIWGNSFIILGYLIRTIRMTKGIDTFDFDLLGIGWISILLCCFASIKAVTLLLKYNEESIATITAKAEQQEKVAAVLSSVAEEIHNRFGKASR